MNRSLRLVHDPVRDMKFFITRGTILRVYREALKLCHQVKHDDGMRDSLVEMVKDEFTPFREARNENAFLAQDSVDFYLAKIRHRINETKTLVDMVR